MTFYTYLWLRDDGSPYYVGKGRGKRAFRKGCPPHNRIVVQEWSDETTAFAYERYQIDFWGRKDLGTGILRNMTDGGEGGATLSLDQRRKLSETMQGNTFSKGQIPSIETRRKMGEARRGNTNGLGNHSNLGFHLSSEHREQISKFMRAKGKSFWSAARRAEQAERMRDVQKMRWAQ
jgi:hypothetical protein